MSSTEEVLTLGVPTLAILTEEIGTCFHMGNSHPPLKLKMHDVSTTANRSSTLALKVLARIRTFACGCEGTTRAQDVRSLNKAHVSSHFRWTLE
jgi:hypothetical protein